MNQIVLLMTSPDQKGLVARITDILYRTNANILNLEQHVEGSGLFFMRIHADTRDISVEAAEFQRQLRELAAELQADLAFSDPERRQRIGVLVTREDACLWELLLKHRSDELGGSVVTIVSNHATLRPIADSFALPYHHVAVTTKAEQESRVRALLREAEVDLVVLARYMQILSPEFVAEYAGRIINIHHGFLPAFKGGRPYHRAWERGVKIIGATAHYVTDSLDEGPIIAQDVISVSHQHSVPAMTQRGRDIERRVLLEAVQAHLEHRIVIHQNRTVIFHP